MNYCKCFIKIKLIILLTRHNDAKGVFVKNNANVPPDSCFETSRCCLTIFYYQVKNILQKKDVFSLKRNWIKWSFSYKNCSPFQVLKVKIHQHKTFFLDFRIKMVILFEYWKINLKSVMTFRVIVWAFQSFRLVKLQCTIDVYKHIMVGTS